MAIQRLKNFLNIQNSGSIIRNYIQLGSMCNSVQLLDCFRATKNLVLVFPKWHPLTVQRDELFQFKYLETRTIAKISIAICKFLQHLHSANLAHCDIKPPNILCKKSILDDNQNELEIDDFCVCDFDDVKQIGTMEWRIFGTAGFTHPNVDFMKENGSRQRMFELEILPYLDIYSLGATVNWFLQFVTRDSALEEHQALMIIASRLMEVDEVTPINISATIKEFEAFC
ncbi:hypothetical protein ROZALSC1DRAFT_30689 [Rozella allomycis CSF55]|uniref:Protein kinase domain-containing protein n=1 Tax=Rozella allomycis (strain CSF55) TaxID=988480 RepID=A0A4P9YGP8_ROZAC|nr:hypothetical protein ROZALSC1DRAFT_30689 [Rozella allomycis CSF55]